MLFQPNIFFYDLFFFAPKGIIMLVQSVCWFVCEQDDKHGATPKSAAQAEHITRPSF